MTIASSLLQRFPREQFNRFFPLVCGILVFSIFLVFGWLFFRTNTFTITTVEVHNTSPAIQAATKQYVLQTLSQKHRLLGNMNIFLVPRTELEQDLPREFPEIRTVQILRKLPGTLIINVQEKIPIAYLQAGDTSYAIDPSGVAFYIIDAAHRSNASLPLVRDEREHSDIRLGSRALPPSVLSSLQDLVSLLPDRFHMNVVDITIPSAGIEELHVQTSEGWTLLLDTERPLQDQLAILNTILAEELNDAHRARLKYVDLRVEGKAYYTFR